jgi:hypothetical protein
MSRSVLYQCTYTEVASSTSLSAQRPDAERGAVSDALGLIEPGRRLGEGVVEGVGHGPDGRQQSVQEQGLPEPQSRILTRFNRWKQHPDNGGVGWDDHQYGRQG